MTSVLFGGGFLVDFCHRWVFLVYISVYSNAMHRFVYKNWKTKRYFPLAKLLKWCTVAFFIILMFVVFCHRYRKTTNKVAFVCVTGQIARLELDSKVNHIITPLKRRGYDVRIVFAMSTAAPHYTTRGDFIDSPYNASAIKRELPQSILHVVSDVKSPPINFDLLKQLNKAFNRREQRKREENHYRQYYTLNECAQYVQPESEINVRVRDDAYVANINWDEIIHHLNKRGAIILTPSYAEWYGLNDKIAFVNREAVSSYFVNPLWRYKETHPAWVVNPETYYFHVYDGDNIVLKSLDSVEVVTTRYGLKGNLKLHGVSPRELQIVATEENKRSVWKYVDCITVINLKSEPRRAETFMREARRVGIPDRIHEQWEDLDPEGGTAGCFRAHIRAVNWAYEKKCENVLVFEPDTYFYGNYEKAFRDMDSFLASGDYFDVFFLGHYPIARLHETNFDGIVRTFSSLDGHARMVSRQFMIKMRQLKYSGIHLDNQLALMKPLAFSVYPMVAFQHAHFSIVSEFKNTRSESGEESLRRKFENAETGAITTGRRCYMCKKNPEKKTMSPQDREALCTWATTRVWLYTDRMEAFLQASSTNIKIGNSTDPRLLKKLQKNLLTETSDIYVFPLSYKTHKKHVVPHKLRRKTENGRTWIAPSSLPIVTQVSDIPTKSVRETLEIVLRDTVYEEQKCGSKLMIWNRLDAYNTKELADLFMKRVWKIHPGYKNIRWNGLNWNSVTTPDHFSHMTLFSLRALVSLIQANKQLFDQEIWRFYTSCGYVCRMQLGKASTHAASFRIMVTVLGHSADKFILEDVQFLQNYPKKTKNNHVLAESMALVLAGTVLKNEQILSSGVFRFNEIFFWYNKAYHIHEDGVVEEESPFYQLYVLDQVVQLMHYIGCWTEIELDKNILDTVSAMATYSHATTLDTGQLFPFGTTPKRKPYGGVGEGVISEESYRLIRKTYPTQKKTYHATKVGHWILHDYGWHIFFNYAASAFVDAHRDFDALSIMIATPREGLWLSDPGPFARKNDKTWTAERAEHFRTTRHHNTVTIDDLDQPASSGKLIEVSPKSIKASFQTHTRFIQVASHAVSIKDTLVPTDSKSHSYTQTWHLDPDVRVQGRRLYKGNECLNIYSPHEIKTRRARHSSDYHKYTNTIEMVITVRNTGKTIIETVFSKCGMNQ